MNKEIYLLEKEIKTEGPLSEQQLLNLSISEMFNKFKVKGPLLLNLLEWLYAITETDQINTTVQVNSNI